MERQRARRKLDAKGVDRSGKDVAHVKALSKGGSNKYPDPKQLKLMALMTFAHHPEINKINAGLLFVAYNSFVDETYQRSDIDSLWASFESDLRRLDNSYVTDMWNPNPTPLCGWCPVKTCEHYKDRR